MEHQLMNPITQLFALFADQLPGCVAPGGRSWAAATESDRESAATEYLFRDALNACDKNSERRFTQKMFKTEAVVVQPRLTRASAKAAAAPIFKQTTLNNLFVQAMIQKEMAPPKKAGKKSSAVTTSTEN